LNLSAAHADIASAVGARMTVEERHLKPELGELLAGDLMAAMVDQFSEPLGADGRIDA
jgi:hypothetical protein